MEYTREERYFIWLASVDGIGPITFGSIINLFGSPEAVFSDAPSRPELLRKVPRLFDKTRTALLAACNEEYLERFFARLEKLGITAICRLNPQYPKALREVLAPPLVLYCIGRLELLAAGRTIAIVGTREPSNYGREVAHRLGKKLGENGIVVVSGMARGIDTCAHLGALEAGGSTVAVLGNGVDIAYPKSKANVYERICREGLVLSEYVPGTQPLPGNFPARNRIISGLSQGVVVVEAGAHSGSNITVNYALEQGKDVFAVPGPILSGVSTSTNQMIKAGCEVITCEDDVLDFYGWGDKPAKRPPKVGPGAAGPKYVELTFQEQALVDVLEPGERSFDDLFEHTGFSLPELFTVLAGLELKGVLEQKPGRLYCLKTGGSI